MHPGQTANSLARKIEKTRCTQLELRVIFLLQPILWPFKNTHKTLKSTTGVRTGALPARGLCSKPRRFVRPQLPRPSRSPILISSAAARPLVQTRRKSQTARRGFCGGNSGRGPLDCRAWGPRMIPARLPLFHRLIRLGSVDLGLLTRTLAELLLSTASDSDSESPGPSTDFQSESRINAPVTWADTGNSSDYPARSGPLSLARASA